jgi:hypothetical protein
MTIIISINTIIKIESFTLISSFFKWLLWHLADSSLLRAGTSYTYINVNFFFCFVLKKISSKWIPICQYPFKKYVAQNETQHSRVRKQRHCIQHTSQIGYHMSPSVSGAAVIEEEVQDLQGSQDRVLGCVPVTFSVKQTLNKENNRCGVLLFI